jgi:hypothetical protein
MPSGKVRACSPLYMHISEILRHSAKLPSSSLDHVFTVVKRATSTHFAPHKPARVQTFPSQSYVVLPTSLVNSPSPHSNMGRVRQVIDWLFRECHEIMRDLEEMSKRSRQAKLCREFEKILNGGHWSKYSPQSPYATRRPWEE